MVFDFSPVFVYQVRLLGISRLRARPGRRPGPARGLLHESEIRRNSPLDPKPFFYGFGSAHLSFMHAPELPSVQKLPVILTKHYVVDKI